MTANNGWDNLIIKNEGEYRYQIKVHDGGFKYKLIVWDPEGRMLKGPFWSDYGNTIIGLKHKARTLVREDKRNKKKPPQDSLVHEGYLK